MSSLIELTFALDTRQPAAIMKTTSALLAAALRNTVGVGCLCALYTIYVHIVQYGYISISYSLPGKTKLKVGCGMDENVPILGVFGT